MKPSSCYALVLLLFRKRRFVALTRLLNRANRHKPRKQMRDEAFPPQQASEIRAALRKSFIAVVLVVAAALITAWLLRQLVGAPSLGLLRWVQYSGVAILLWATLAQVGWRIRTIGQVTLPEELDRLLYRIFYLVGSYLLALSVAWHV
jgi:hypothetical protein